MTAFGSVSTAVEAMKYGAFDYVQKPFEIEEMEVKIEKALELKRLRHELDYLRHEQQENYDFDKIIGSSDTLQRVLSVVRKVAKSNSTVLIRGETGTGKELIAGAIHHNSLRAARNFVKVNCAALQETLIECELFGHEKGAFTGADRQRIGRFEQADGGTLFLDEIGDMSASTQAKLLRVLQEHEFERLGGTRDDPRRRAPDRRHQPRPVGDGRGRAVPRRPLLPPERRARWSAAAARAQGRHPAAGDALHPPLRQRAEEEARRPRHRRAEAAGRATTGPATSASSRTRSSARRCSPRRR